MSRSLLPERPSLEYLKKLAKDRLHALRQVDPHTKLSAAQLAVARDYGFPSWRALRTVLGEHRSHNVAAFFEACTHGQIDGLRSLLAVDPTLVRADNPRAPHRGWTGLHESARHGHVDCVRFLLEQGADPNAREAGDNTYPLHWAAAAGHLDVVRALLDAGGDAKGAGDVHELDAIGWATYFHPAGGNPEVVSLLVERGARHHIFSALSIGEPDLIRKVAGQDSHALRRRMSRFEGGQTPLHFAISRKRYDLLDVLIAVGADLEAEDHSGHTALATAMMRGDQEAMIRLHTAGAKANQAWNAAAADSEQSATGFHENMVQMAGSIRKGIPMIRVPDVAATLAWYVSIGFKEVSRFEDDGVVNFGMLSFGKAEMMLSMGGKAGSQDVSLWFYTSHIDELYRLLYSRQMAAAHAGLTGRTAEHPGVEFVEDINDTFYRAREFGIRDPNGYVLYFIQPLDQ